MTCILADGSAPPRVHVLGADVDLVTSTEIIGVVERAVDERRRTVIGHHNLHSLHLVSRHPEMRTFYAHADLVYADGMPIVAWARLLGHPARREHRNTSLDWYQDFFDRAAMKGWRIFVFGGRPGVADRALHLLRERHPGLVAEAAHGYIPQRRDAPECQALLERINAFRADVVIVGLGMPLQEAWAEACKSGLDAPVILTIGALFDYVAGEVPEPPRLMGRMGLEWLHRLASEPRRLGKRYLVEPWSLVPDAARDVIGRLRSRPTTGG